MNTPLTIALAALLALPLAAAAGKVYKVVDEHGNVSYSDKPPAANVDFQTLKLPATNRTPAVARPRSQGAQPADDTAAFNGYRHIQITTPSNHQTIPPGQHEVSVELALTPALQPGHRLQLVFDGQRWGEPVTTTGLVLHSMARGAHSIVLEVQNANGHVIGRSAPVTIHVKRPNRLGAAVAVPSASEQLDGAPEPGAGVAGGPNSPFSMPALQRRQQSRKQ